MQCLQIAWNATENIQTAYMFALRLLVDYIKIIHQYLKRFEINLDV